MTDHLKEAYDGLMTAKNWEEARDAALDIVLHLRTATPAATGREETAPDRPLNERNSVMDRMVDELAKQYQKACIYGELAGALKRVAASYGYQGEPKIAGCGDGRALEFARSTLDAAWREHDEQQPKPSSAEVSEGLDRELQRELDALEAICLRTSGKPLGSTEKAAAMSGFAAGRSSAARELSEKSARIEELEAKVAVFAPLARWAINNPDLPTIIYEQLVTGDPNLRPAAEREG